MAKNSGSNSKKVQRIERAKARQKDANASGRAVKDKRTGKMRPPILYTPPAEKAVRKEIPDTAFDGVFGG